MQNFIACRVILYDLVRVLLNHRYSLDRPGSLGYGTRGNKFRRTSRVVGPVILRDRQSAELAA
jgi:hypothetical protein